MSSSLDNLVPIQDIIFIIRDQRVMLDSDLARLYGVKTKHLIQSVKRNIERFPVDFMFQLSYQEVVGLRSQIVTLNNTRGQHRKYLPYAFTEQGVAMLSSVLNSKRAIEVNIQIMRVFVYLKKVISSNDWLLKKINEFEQKHRKHDEHIEIIFDAIKQLIIPKQSEKERIGF